MAEPRHHFRASVEWTGATSGSSFSRAHVIRIEGKPEIHGSAALAFRGDAARHDPEGLLIASLAACHMLSYLWLCARAKVTVTRYSDAAEGTLKLDGAAGRFERVVLHPRVTIAPGSDLARATGLHGDAHRICFVSNSVNFPVDYEPLVEVAAN
jgi:organic hydroperoxide reductase OsmC/OhrA